MSSLRPNSTTKSIYVVTKKRSFPLSFKSFIFSLFTFSFASFLFHSHLSSIVENSDRIPHRGKINKSIVDFSNLQFDNFTFHLKTQTESGSNGKCISLNESKSYYPPSMPPSSNFLNSLRRQEILQEKCTANIQNWNEHFQKSEKGFEKCKYLIWIENEQGLGNRLLSLLSAFMYSILTERVLVMDARNNMDKLICNPFPNSASFLPKNFDFDSLKESMQQSDFLEESNKKSMKMNHLYINIRWYSMLSDNQMFFCDDMQKKLKSIRWLTFDTEMYVIPGFYFVFQFRKVLEAYFPSRQIISYISRYFLFPTNQIWQEITQTYQTHFSNAKLRIGIQIRSFSDYNETITKRVISCLTENQILPTLDSDPLQSNQVKKKSNEFKNSNPNLNSSTIDYFVYIASLDDKHYEYMQAHIHEYFDINKSRIVLHKVTDGMMIESHSLDQSAKAIIDIWLLSMSDTLLTSYISTFGYIAKALSFRQAYMLNICELFQLPDEDRWSTNQKRVCHLSRSSEACFLVSPTALTCGAEMSFSYLTKCDDAVEGLALLS